MKILFYDTKPYDKESFDEVIDNYDDIEMEEALLKVEKLLNTLQDAGIIE